MAQQNSLTVKSFELKTNDLTAINASTQKIDDNGEVCALIKIVTTQKGFVYDGGTIGIVLADENQVGENWVYVPARLRRITIKHPTLGVLRDYFFPIPIESGRTYIMELVTGTSNVVVNATVQSQYLEIHYEPKNAMVEIDYEAIVSDNGMASAWLSFGKHTYRISAQNFHPETGIVELSDPDQTKVVNVKLSPAFGYLAIVDNQTLNGGDLYVDDEKITSLPCDSIQLPSGSHIIYITNTNYHTYQAEIIIEDGHTMRISPTLEGNYKTYTISSGEKSEIWIDNKNVGIGSCTVNLAPGEHKFETRMNGHKSQNVNRIISFTDTKEIVLPTPIPIYGSIKIDSKAAGSSVYLDGEKKGTTPILIPNVLACKHVITVKCKNMQDEVRNVDVKENETTELYVTLQKKIVIQQKVSADCSGTYIIPEGTTCISDSAFMGCRNITSIVIPNSVDSIGLRAFYGCENIETISLPKKLRHLGEVAFGFCLKLKSISIHDNVTYLGAGAFVNCISLQSIHIPSKIKTIGKWTFLKCEKLEDITIPNEVTSIDEAAFGQCMSITQITLPEGLLSIATSAFMGCSNLRHLKFNENLKEIGNLAFSGCEALNEITLPKSITNIGDGVFTGVKKINIDSRNDRYIVENGILYQKNKNIKNKILHCSPYNSGTINIPSGVTSIGAQAFMLCYNITSIVIPESVTSIGENAFSATAIKSITLPDNISIIPNSAFIGCIYLETVHLPNGLQIIGDEAFANCYSLQTIKIPNGVKSIGNATFANCNNLITITIPKTVESIGEGVLYNSTNVKYIYVPYGYKKTINTILKGNFISNIVETDLP